MRPHPNASDPPSPKDASRTLRRFGGLLLGVLIGLLIAAWLWRAPTSPGTKPLAVGESVVLRTPGGKLEVAEVRQLESFEVSRDHRVLGVPVGSTFSRIRVPAHYRYHLDLAPEWTVRVQPDGSVRVIAPRLKPSLPVAVDTGRLEKESRGLWSLFTGPSELEALEKSISAALERKAVSADMLARPREAARLTVAEFIGKWLMTQTPWKPLAGKPIQVLFADEPIEALDQACQGQPGCATSWLNAAGH